VGRALDAVQMASPWPCSPAQAAVPALCPAGLVPSNVFFENFEGGFARWPSQLLAGSDLWGGGSFFATSGTYHLYGDDSGVDAVGDDSAVFLNTPVALPADARLQFNHAYGFDNVPGQALWLDGGVLEYSTNGGGAWADASGLITAGATYGGILQSSFGNPLGGRAAFVGESWGYTATQLGLGSLAGQNFQVRFRIGTDQAIGDFGWFIDDVRIYVCQPPPPPAVSIDDVAVPEGSSGTTTAAVTVRLSGTYHSPITVNAATQNGSAQAPGDYAAASTTLNFPVGSTAATFNVAIVGDATSEPNEAFFVNLSNASSGAPIVDVQGEVRIMDDDVSGYFPVPPCRGVDTRGPAGPTGGPALAAATERNFPVAGLCGVPVGAKAVALNVTAVNPSHDGDFRLRAAGSPQPLISTINFKAGRTRANSAVVRLGVAGQITVTTDMPIGSGGTVHFIYDVAGYFR
jgi:hypothetical protein